jgi:mono/diheme cytochrome c family protein
MRFVVVAFVALLLLSLAWIVPIPERDTGTAIVPAEAEDYYALLDEYCVSCHDDVQRTADLAFNTMDLSRIAEHGAVWEKVIRKLRAGMMPPIDNPKPEKEDAERLVAWLEATLDEAALEHPNPGRAPIHRLNRTEYGNAILDLLNLEIAVAELLPPDTESHGFDNMADALRISPSLMEQYLDASRKVASLALGDPRAPAVTQVYRVPPDRAQAFHIEGLPLGTRGGTLIRHNFPLDGEYDFRVFLTRNIVGYMTGLEWPHQLEISIDGERVFLADVGGEADNEMSDANFAEAANTIDDRLRTRVPVKAGVHEVAVAFLQKSAAESHEPLELHTRDLDLQNMNGLPNIDYVTVTGPLDAQGPGETASRRAILTCRPANAKEEPACAKQILSRLARRAYRRPVTDGDVALLMSFYEAGRQRGGFDTGLQSALRMILTSPEFLFRAAPDPEGMEPGTVYPLGDIPLASRLSFFLWSTIPDDELLSLAEQGRLSDPAVLEQQVKRMLADPRAAALTQNFAGQWLFLRNLDSAIPDVQTFPNFDDNLRQDFLRETELFFASIVQEDRSVLDLLDADYTFLNERLALHYGVPNIYGSHFRRVHVLDEMRRGLLGQGSVLTVTSYPNRTSPVLRGKYILENLLGSPPPAPPKDVPALEETKDQGRLLSVRERLEQHRKNPNCASCHAVMDPLGFALENFDAVGRWRVKDAAGPIDARGQLADGTEVKDAVSLRQAILSDPDRFVETLTEKLLTYALGRGLEHYDMPVVRDIAHQAASKDYRFSALILGIAESVPFRMKKAQAAGEPILTVAEADD